MNVQSRLHSRHESCDSDHRKYTIKGNIQHQFNLPVAWGHFLSLWPPKPCISWPNSDHIELLHRISSSVTYTFLLFWMKRTWSLTNFMQVLNNSDKHLEEHVHFFLHTGVGWLRNIELSWVKRTLYTINCNA